MRFHESVLDLVGDTPLVRLNRLTEGLAPTVLAKLEYFNPGGSAKDRIALGMVLSAEASGALRPGGTIVEPTSGNTGVGLALVAQQRGYRCVFTCPDKVSSDKIAVLRAFGAEVVICPAAVPITHPSSYRSTAARLATEIPDAYQPDQYSHPANSAAHYASTGPELWAQTEGEITHFVTGVGTGGTISGTGRYLKEASGGRVRVIGADPEGSVYSHGGARPYLVEGVGQPSLPRSFDPAVPDEIIAVTDRDSIRLTRRLAREEGILTGGSGGMAVAAALEVAARTGPEAVIVVLIPDSGRGYLSKIFDDGWVHRHGFETQPGEGLRVSDLFDGGERPLTVVDPGESVAGAIKMIRAAGTGQLPVGAGVAPLRLAEIIGTVSLAVLAEHLLLGRLGPDDPVSEHLAPPPPVVGWGQSLSEAREVVAACGLALVVDGGLPRCVISATDIVSLLDRRTEGEPS